MNWIRENKFLSVFFGFVAVAAGALIFLIVQALGQYGDVDAAYKSQVTKLNNLQHQVPYPNSENLETYKAQKTTLNDEVSKVQQNLGKYQFPVEDMTPEQFQDRLRASVNAINDKAKQLGTKGVLPAKFALGFERYLTEPPNRDAAPLLGQELQAVEFIVNELLDRKIDSIVKDIDRAPLPEENNQKPPKDLVLRHPIVVTFVSEQGRFRTMLNDIISSTKQFYIVSLIQVKNQKPVSPARASASAAPAPSANQGRLTFIFGAEKVEVTMKIEIVDFAAASGNTASGK